MPTSTFAPGVSLRIQAVVSGGVSHTATADSITILADKLLNSNFELWTIHDAEMGPPDNWAVDGGEYGVDCTVKRANQHQVDGAYCAVMEALSPGSYAMYQEQRNGAPGTRWRFSCRIYDDNPLVSGVLRIQFLDAERNVLLTTNAVPSSDGIDAQALQVESVSPELAEVVRYGVVLEAEAPGSIYVDYSKFEADPVVTFESPIGGEPLYFDSTNSLTVQWNYGASQVPIDSARLEVSLQDSSNWELISRIPSGDVTSFAWFGVDEYSRDVRFRVTAWYLSGTSVQSISNPIKLGPASFTQSLSGNWHLWSPPLLPNNRSIDAVIGNNLKAVQLPMGT